MLKRIDIQVNRSAGGRVDRRTYGQMDKLTGSGIKSGLEERGNRNAGHVRDFR